MANLTEEARRLKAQYTREWRAKNPDKVKAHNNSYWERKAQKLAAGSVTNSSSVTGISVTEKLNVTKSESTVTSLDRAIAYHNSTSEPSSDVRCANCGEIFIPKRSDARFCSTRCRVQYNRIIKGS